MSQATKRIYEFGSFRLDSVRRLLSREGEPVPLTSKSFETLLALVESRGEILVKDELLSRVWPDTVVEEKNLTINISALRKVLGERPDEHRDIVTVPGRGYRFVADVQEITDGETELIVQQSRMSVVVEEEVDDAAREATRFLAPSSVRPFGRARRMWLALAALVVVMAGAGYWWQVHNNGKSKSSSPPSTIQSLAVLPFRSLNPQRGADSNEDYLGVGMADVTITRLGSLNQLVVRPTRAVLPYATQDPLQAGHSLKVDSVLDGSIQQSGDRMRVTLRLLRVEDGKALWTYQCDESCTDLFALQDAIADKVTQALALRLTPREHARLKQRQTTSSEAQELYLKGRYFWTQRSDAGIKQAITYLTQATQRDPQFALAFAALADCYNIVGENGIMPPQEAYPQAKAAAHLALELDEELAEGHASLAMAAFLHDWDFAGAALSFQRSIELNPNLALAHHFYGYSLMLTGRLDEALAETKRALECDPLSLTSNTQLGANDFYAHRYDQALDHCRRTLELDVNFVPALSYLAQTYEEPGQYDEALRTLERFANLVDGRIIQAMTGHVQAVARRSAAAESALASLRQKAQRQYVSPYLFALLYSGLGQRDRALASLEQCYQEHSSTLLYLKVEPRLDPLRADPRFAELMRRVGLTQ
jgi:DNA-binding winged helix-turn-helix (wHTH) protein/TolB-like protein